ncbi:hypothetical protein [Paeniglutamicibacter cryotolerans]|uniref:Helix-turn-helix domain-containing protein n=1 Tax=Paeniglutamicibacter cryotolerans TaxID=670079 RepID=A0A839QS90_9MICC|nr:hypothetical protein [Paeniglutamicibacter cryotolerans]MBB2997644.1 hypothetical protein [Paeniglutamicibacter cryotolerans]
MNAIFGITASLVHLAGKHTTVETAELFGVAHSTVYPAIKRAGDITK